MFETPSSVDCMDVIRGDVPWKGGGAWLDAWTQDQPGVKFLPGQLDTFDMGYLFAMDLVLGHCQA